MRLDNLYLIGDKTHDRLHLLPTLVNGRPNHDAMRLDDEGMQKRYSDAAPAETCVVVSSPSSAGTTLRIGYARTRPRPSSYSTRSSST